MPAPKIMAVINTIVSEDTPSPSWASPDTTPWADATEIPMVINGSNTVTGRR